MSWLGTCRLTGLRAQEDLQRTWRAVQGEHSGTRTTPMRSRTWRSRWTRPRVPGRTRCSRGSRRVRRPLGPFRPLHRSHAISQATAQVLREMGGNPQWILCHIPFHWAEYSSVRICTQPWRQGDDDHPNLLYVGEEEEGPPDTTTSSSAVVGTNGEDLERMATDEVTRISPPSAGSRPQRARLAQAHTRLSWTPALHRWRLPP